VNLPSFLSHTISVVNTLYYYDTVHVVNSVPHRADHRGELSYLAPLGSENISAPYFKQCFFGGNGSIAWTCAVSHVGRTSNAFKVTMKLQTFLFQMVVTSCTLLVIL